MKARVKNTGEIVEVHTCDDADFVDRNGKYYWEHELFFGSLDEHYDDPDYWTRLEHQYVGMAMQGILTDGWGSTYISNPKSKEQHLAIVTNAATEIAHALVEKMKEEKYDRAITRTRYMR